MTQDTVLLMTLVVHNISRTIACTFTCGNVYITPCKMSNSPPLEIRYATESDTHAIGQINIAAFRDSPLFDNAFPGAATSALEVLKQNDNLEKLEHPSVHVLATVDPTTGTMVGFSRWEIPAVYGFERPVVELSPEGKTAVAEMTERAPQPVNHEIWGAFKAMIRGIRRKHCQEGDIS